MAVRILRVIEYVYPDGEMAENDMIEWDVPAIGSKSFRSGIIIRSAIITDLSYTEDAEPYDPSRPQD